MIWALVVSVLLLVANGFFVAVEFAVVGSRRTKLEEADAQGDRRARRALAATGDLNRELGGAQLGITMASLGLGLVAEPALAHALTPAVEALGAGEALAHTIAFVVGLAVVVFAHLLIGELVPKNLSLVDPDAMLMRLAGLDRAYLTVFGPVVRILTAMANVCLRALRIEPRRELRAAHTAEEIAVMLEASREEGLIEDFAADLMTGVLDFGGLQVADVMVPRDQIAFLGQDTTVAEAERVVVERGHSRFPLVGAGLDDVLGFVHAKDLLTLPAGGADRPLPLSIVRRMLVVPVDRSLEDLLLGMRRARVHFALVRDGAGDTVGIVTLEDLLEELVGDILDESDRDRG